jgi:tRNA (guanine37-N1)-methyltransferase
MKIDVLTLFPEMFAGIINQSIIKRALEKNIVEINFHNFRDYSQDLHKKVDDYPYGGGSGMVLSIIPIYNCLQKIKNDDSFIILLTPQGIKYKQDVAYDLTKKKHLILICGHYEGFDERIRSLVNMEISIGDYVLTGGEIPSMVIIDSVTRLLEGAITSDSLTKESFNNNLLDYPQYTKPQNFLGMEVPEVLLSGHHKNIDLWRTAESLKRTKLRRPDLFEKE